MFDPILVYVQQNFEKRGFLSDYVLAMALAATPTSSAPPGSSVTMPAGVPASANNGGAPPGNGSGHSGSSAASELRFSGHTLDKATKAKLTLENYYSTLISQHKERRERWKRLEDTLKVKPDTYFYIKYSFYLSRLGQEIF